MNKVALICVVVFIITLGGQAAAQNITWHNSNLEACQILDQNNYFVAGWDGSVKLLKTTDA